MNMVITGRDSVVISDTGMRSEVNSFTTYYECSNHMPEVYTVIKCD